MTNEQKEISNAFLDGMYELFDIMFTNHVKLSFMDEEHTDVDDIYKESEHKKYLDPVEILGKVVPDLPHAENPKMGVERTLTITVPTKSFILQGIDISPNSYDKFRKARITFDGVDYNVVSFKPKTLVAETYLFYEIKCSDQVT